MKIITSFAKYLFLFSVMGSAYMTIEVLWRGYSHFSMFLLAGICGVLIGRINDVLPRDTPVWLRMFIGTGIILVGEFISGCILNLWLKLDIWDYSDLPFNILGQVCLPFAFAWFSLSLAAILVNDYLCYWFFGEEKPRYFWGFRHPDSSGSVSAQRKQISPNIPFTQH